jgi:hypothetical protein
MSDEEIMSKLTRVSHPIYQLLPMEIEGFDSLAELALDMHWSWNHATDQVWRQLDPELWEITHNPWIVLQTVSRDQIESVLDRDRNSVCLAARSHQGCVKLALPAGWREPPFLEQDLAYVPRSSDLPQVHLRRGLGEEISESDACEILPRFEHAIAVAAELALRLATEYFIGDARGHNFRLRMRKNAGFGQHHRDIRLPSSGNRDGRRVSDRIDPFRWCRQRARVHGKPARRVRKARIAQKRGWSVRRDRDEQVIGKILALLKTKGSGLRIDG